MNKHQESIVIDTCGWIEWLTDDVLCDKYTLWFEQMDSVIVPTSIQFELYKDPKLNNFRKWRRIFIPVQGRESGV